MFILCSIFSLFQSISVKGTKHTSMPVKNVTQKSKLKFDMMVHFLTLSLKAVSSQVFGVLLKQQT